MENIEKGYEDAYLDFGDGKRVKLGEKLEISKVTLTEERWEEVARKYEEGRRIVEAAREGECKREGIPNLSLEWRLDEAYSVTLPNRSLRIFIPSYFVDGTGDPGVKISITIPPGDWSIEKDERLKPFSQKYFKLGESLINNNKTMPKTTIEGGHKEKEREEEGGREELSHKQHMAAGAKELLEVSGIRFMPSINEEARKKEGAESLSTEGLGEGLPENYGGYKSAHEIAMRLWNGEGKRISREQRVAIIAPPFAGALQAKEVYVVKFTDRGDGKEWAKIYDCRPTDEELSDEQGLVSYEIKPLSELLGEKQERGGW